MNFVDIGEGHYLNLDYIVTFGFEKQPSSHMLDGKPEIKFYCYNLFEDSDWYWDNDLSIFNKVKEKALSDGSHFIEVNENEFINLDCVTDFSQVRDILHFNFGDGSGSIYKNKDDKLLRKIQSMME